jgi:hypothetical protein
MMHGLTNLKVKERVELYLYYPSRAFMASSRVKFTFNVILSEISPWS